MDHRKIKQIRADLSLTQHEVAQLLGCHWVTVSKWERGVLEPTTHMIGMLSALGNVALRKGAAEIGKKAAEMIITHGVVDALVWLLLSQPDKSFLPRAIQR